MRLLSTILALLPLLAGCAIDRPVAAPTSPATSSAFRNGVDANFRPTPENLRRLAAAGATHFRVRLWTIDNGPSGLHDAAVTAKAAQAAGLKPYLVIFLSDDWADSMKQPVPAEWKNYAPDNKLKAVEAYAALVTKHFRDAGVTIDFYEIGNEIDFGLCGVFTDDLAKRVSVDYLRSRVWPEMVPILTAAQAGVRQGDPAAKFTLHLAQWDWPDHCAAFFRFMLDRGVAVDLAGLSYFPTSVPEDRSSLAAFGRRVDALAVATGRPVVVCEYAYPAADNFGGQFGDWNKPVTGYPLTHDGQRRWVADFLAAMRANPNAVGAYYWSPEWNRSAIWHAFSLFDADDRPRPALGSLGE